MFSIRKSDVDHCHGRKNCPFRPVVQIETLDAVLDLCDECGALFVRKISQHIKDRTIQGVYEPGRVGQTPFTERVTKKGVDD